VSFPRHRAGGRRQTSNEIGLGQPRVMVAKHEKFPTMSPSNCAFQQLLQLLPARPSQCSLLIIRSLVMVRRSSATARCCPPAGFFPPSMLLITLAFEEFLVVAIPVRGCAAAAVSGMIIWRQTSRVYSSSRHSSVLSGPLLFRILSE